MIHSDYELTELQDYTVLISMWCVHVGSILTGDLCLETSLFDLREHKITESVIDMIKELQKGSKTPICIGLMFDCLDSQPDLCLIRKSAISKRETEREIYFDLDSMTLADIGINYVVAA